MNVKDLQLLCVIWKFYYDEDMILFFIQEDTLDGSG